MPDLATQSRNLMDARQQRGINRELTRINQHGQLAAAHGITEVEIAQSVTEAALLATAHVSALEASLTGMVPHAEPRLRHIADAGALAMAQTVVKAGRS